MIDIDIKKLKKDELLKLREQLDEQLFQIDSLKFEMKSLGEKKRLLDLVKGDKIFAVSFSRDFVYNSGFVEMEFSPRSDERWTNFTSTHDTKPLGCSSAILTECLLNHCCLSEFSDSYMYFFTINPKTWKEDLRSEIKRISKNKKAYFNEDLNKFQDNINTFIKSNYVSEFIKDIETDK